MKHEPKELAADKPMMQRAINKHEAAMHPGKPKTKLASGGMVARGGGAAKKGMRFTRNG